MKLGGMHSAAEAVNFLVNKIGQPYIMSYVNHVSSHPNAQKAPHAVVPDIHAFNFPTGGQRVDESGATSAAEAFFKIKTFTACKCRYNHNNTNLKPVDQRVHEVILFYDQKFKKLYLMIKNARSWIVFLLLMLLTMEQVRLWARLKKPIRDSFKGTIMPIHAGWFGKVNKDYKLLSQRLHGKLQQAEMMVCG